MAFVAGLAAVGALVTSGLMAVGALTATQWATSFYKLADSSKPHDADLVLVTEAIGTVAASAAASGTTAPGTEATTSLPKVNNALTADNFNYTFELKESR